MCISPSSDKPATSSKYAPTAQRRGRAALPERPSARASRDSRPSAAMTIRAACAHSPPVDPFVTMPSTVCVVRRGAETVTPSSMAAPAVAACWTRYASSLLRGTDRPRRPSAYRPSIATAPGPVTRMPASGQPVATSGAIGITGASVARAPGLSVSPQSLWRGNVARSKTRTRTPARARIVAASAPAGPAPTMMTSVIWYL